MTARRILTLSGADALPFLQGLVTNDVLPLGRADGIVYAALLTPQGKFLCDFFVVAQGGRLRLDLPEALAEATLRRLAMYRLRADVRWAEAGETVTCGTGPVPEGALPDPRHAGLGWRLYGPGAPAPDAGEDAATAALRVELMVPETGRELLPDESYILEMGFERLHGVDFRKGCYVGQEVTARMKHKTELRKGLVRLDIAAEAAPGTPVLTADGREAGRVHTVAGRRALAYLRLDRAGEPLTAGGAAVLAVTPASTGETLPKV